MIHLRIFGLIVVHAVGKVATLFIVDLATLLNVAPKPYAWSS